MAESFDICAGRINHIETPFRRSIPSGQVINYNYSNAENGVCYSRNFRTLAIDENNITQRAQHTNSQVTDCDTNDDVSKALEALQGIPECLKDDLLSCGDFRGVQHYGYGEVA